MSIKGVNQPIRPKLKKALLLWIGGATRREACKKAGADYNNFHHALKRPIVREFVARNSTIRGMSYIPGTAEYGARRREMNQRTLALKVESRKQKDRARYDRHVMRGRLALRALKELGIEVKLPTGG